MSRRKPDSPPRVPTSAELASDHSSAAGIHRLLPPLPRSFYLRPTLTVARDLPGKYLVRRSGKGLLIARIVEVEAYLGARDPASHAFRGQTPRNDVMFWKGGHLYVYFTYGMHFCCNVVTEKEGKGMAVLIRAGEPVAGLTVMMRRRRTSDPTLLCGGPARLCQAMGIGRKENGTDLCGKEVWIAGDPEVAAGTTRTRGVKLDSSTRIGIREGREHRWRFYIRGNPHVSKGRPSGPDGRWGPPSGSDERGGRPTG
jgi:DNA-3-methyladenine glycosylase